MSLPSSRNTNYAPTSPILSNDLNAIQDCIIGGKSGTRKRCIAPKVLNNAIGTSWALNAGNFIISSGAGTAILEVPCEVGDRITGLEILALGNGVVDVTFDLNLVDVGMAVTSKANITDVNRAAAWGLVTPVVTATTIGANERLALSCNANAAAYQIGGIWLLYFRP